MPAEVFAVVVYLKNTERGNGNIHIISLNIQKVLKNIAPGTYISLLYLWEFKLSRQTKCIVISNYPNKGLPKLIVNFMTHVAGVIVLGYVTCKQLKLFIAVQ